MRILHVIFSLKYGGLETMLRDLTAQQCLTDDVTVLIINDMVDPGLLATFDSRVKVLRYNRREGSNPLWLMLRLNIDARRLAPDVIHMHNPKAPGLLRGLDRKLVFTIHDERVPHRYLRPSIRMAAISEAVRADMAARMPRADISVILNGITPGTIAVRSARRPGPEFHLVQVARLDAPKKGQDILLRALALLPGHVTLDLVGEGASMDELRRLAATLGLADRVNFLGLRDRNWIYSHLCEYDLMVHPSRKEGFGLTIAEAMAAALPVAVSEGGGPFEVIDRGRLGAHFALTGSDEQDARNCAEAIRSVIADYDSALTVAQTARQFALDHYTIARMACEYRSLYSAAR